jgi:cytochrome P450
MSARSCHVEFDHNSLDHPVETYNLLRSTSPVSWAESNGGYWVVTGYEEVAEALSHPEVFASGLTHGPGGEPEGGIFIPAEKALVPMIPTEVDPPWWRDYRMLLVRQFSPSAVEAMRPMIEEVTRKQIDQVIDSGRCDMVLDLAAPIPAATMLELMDLDADEWAFWAEPYHDALGYPPGSEKFEQAIEGLEDIVDRIRELVRERRESPGADLISTVVGAEIEAEPISEENAVAVVYTLFSGGVDTTTSFLANAFAYLSRNDEDRRLLIEDPSRIRLATEELMRLASPVQALGRTVKEETTLGGQAFASANRDEGIFDSPHSCVIDRYPNKHLAFGRGIHKCVGAHLARTEIEIVIREVLARIPDFTIDEEKSSQYPNIGIVNGWVRMPAAFTPPIAA